MKFIIGILISVNLLFGFSYNLEPKAVNNDIYCFFGDVKEPNKYNNGFMVNSCYIKEDGFYIVVDSGPTYIFAKESYEAMKKIYDLPVKYVINTHSHDDHFLGNGYFKSLGAVIYASERFHENRNDGRMHEHILPEAFDGTTTVLPDKYLTNAEEIILGTTKIINKGLHGHSTSDIIVYHEKSKTMLVGDLVFNERLLALRDGTIKGWLDYIEFFKAYDYEYLIGGHGHDTSRDSYIFTKDYLTRLENEVRKAIEMGEGIDESAKTIKFDDFSDYALYEELHSKNVFKAYQLLEWE